MREPCKERDRLPSCLTVHWRCWPADHPGAPDHAEFGLCVDHATLAHARRAVNRVHVFNDKEPFCGLVAEVFTCDGEERLLALVPEIREDLPCEAQVLYWLTEDSPECQQWWGEANHD